MTSETPLEGKGALVTGASSGIGQATARSLAKRGASVALAARRKDRLQTLAESIEMQLETDALALQTDVTQEPQVRSTVETAVEAFGGLDVVVSNAGISGPGAFSKVTTKWYRKLMEVNVDGTFFVTRTVLPYLRESNGSLVFVGSFAGEYPRSGNAVYAASKWWVKGFALSLAGTVGKDGVAVSLVNPSEVRTEAGEEQGEQMKKRYGKGQVLEPEGVAETIAFVVEQEPPTAIAEVDVYRRDRLSSF